jgi:hypothetical protein
MRQQHFSLARINSITTLEVLELWAEQSTAKALMPLTNTRTHTHIDSNGNMQHIHIMRIR